MSRRERYLYAYRERYGRTPAQLAEYREDDQE